MSQASSASFTLNLATLNTTKYHLNLFFLALNYTKKNSALAMATKKRSRSQKNFCIFYIFWYFPISAVPCEELYKSLNVFVKHLPYIHLELYLLLFAHINAVR